VEQVTQNAADALFDGVELEVNALVGDNLTLNASIGWLDARYDGFCQDLNGPQPNDPSLVPCASPIGGAQPVDLTDLPLARSPEWTYRLNAIYEAEIGQGVAAFSLEWVYTDEQMTLDQGAPAGTADGLVNFNGEKVNPMRDSTEMVNGSITWRDHENRYKVSLYGKNLTNELYYRRLSYAPPVLAFGTLNNPREFGVEFSYSF